VAGYFFDTSALVKRYRPEEGTDAIDRVFAEQGAVHVISRLGMVETVSALALKVRTGELEDADYVVARKKFLGDISQKNLKVVRILVAHFRTAERLIDRHGRSKRIRTLDALQLSIALEMHQQGGVATFVCADAPLCEIAALEGLATLNPLQAE
jgi:predicted nucleic acid-binding protein